MLNQSTPTFEEWVTYCFTQGHDDFSRKSPDGEAAAHARQARFLSMDPSLLTTYLTRLFESPSFVVERYTDNQIAAATWFIFGNGSGYIGDMHCGAVEQHLQVRCVRSITTLYTDLFDRVCGRHGTDPDADLRDTVEVDSAVYMMWDMGKLEVPVMFPERGPHLVEPGVDVLERVLRECRTGACRVSALHGIGHIYCAHKQRDNAIAARLRAIVDAFTQRADLPEWLRDYAALAREGDVL